MSFGRPTATRAGNLADRRGDSSLPDAPERPARHFQVGGDERREHLEALRRVVCFETSFIARLVTWLDADSMYLRVVNADAARLAEDIGCRAEEDGGYSFTWSWGDPIGPADDLNGAVRAIRRVLASGC
ncbi:hypothetical protein [Thermomonospora amylolytica]|uniref:hypothetical protein n=1 Tax=Thermomonospora amylolytica TaxID=1411117 RepID=UPI001300345F|nr:hypothetical protein [Thermomonospora amylolytica]